MKPFYYISITTSSLIFLACTPIPTPSYPKQVNQINQTTTPIKTATSSLNKSVEIRKIPTIVQELTKTKKEPVEVIKPPLNTKIIETKAEVIKIEPQTTNVTTAITSIKESSKVDEYGNPPKHYRDTIRKYLSKKADRGDSIKFVFSRPYKAEKNDKSWNGWAVEVDMLKRNGQGKVLRNKPYTILFNGSSIVEDLSEAKASTLSKVVY